MVREILSEYKIGTLLEDPAEEKKRDLSDPYWNEPERHPAIRVNKLTPFNGEPAPSLLGMSFITPNDIHFIRNRLPVPDINVNNNNNNINVIIIIKIIIIIINHLL